MSEPKDTTPPPGQQFRPADEQPERAVMEVYDEEFSTHFDIDSDGTVTQNMPMDGVYPVLNVEAPGPDHEITFQEATDRIRRSEVDLSSLRVSGSSARMPSASLAPFSQPAPESTIPVESAPRPHHSMDGIVQRRLRKAEDGTVGVSSMFIVPPGVAAVATPSGMVSMTIDQFPDWWKANGELLGYVDPVASLDDEGGPTEGEGDSEHVAVADPAEEPSPTADHEADPAPDVQAPADDGSPATLPFAEHGDD